MNVGANPNASIATPFIMEYKARQGLLWLGYVESVGDLDEITAQAFMLIGKLDKPMKQGGSEHGQ